MKKKLLLTLLFSFILCTTTFASQVKTFESRTKKDLDKQVNDFIKNKDVKTISYTIGQSSNLGAEIIFKVQNLEPVYSCMVLYEE